MQELEASLSRIKVGHSPSPRFCIKYTNRGTRRKLSPELVSVEQVRQVITKIQVHLPPITGETAREMYRLASTQVKETEHC